MHEGKNMGIMTTLKKPTAEREDLQGLASLTWRSSPASYTVVEGPSGSGTFTLRNLIAGMTIPTPGHSWVEAS
jgi:ABC-type thiamine transport system ATPase subunit